MIILSESYIVVLLFGRQGCESHTGIFMCANHCLNDLLSVSNASSLNVLLTQKASVLKRGT